MAGRKCEDIASAFELAILQDRDVAHLILFMDDCAAQNKNYALFTTLLSLINSDRITTNTITLKYLEAGHTFMSAGSCHAAVEREMKKAINVYDFSEFRRCIEAAGAWVIEPNNSQFKEHQGQQSNAKLKHPERPMLADIRQAEFRRGERVVYYKKLHNDTDWSAFDYLKAKHKLSEPISQYTTPRGVATIKKNDIVKNLCKLMPSSRHIFWNDLSINDAANDLIESHD